MRKRILFGILLLLTGSSVAVNVGTNGDWQMVSPPYGEISLSEIKNSCDHVGGPWIWSRSNSDYVGSEVMIPTEGYWLKTRGNCNINVVRSGGYSTIDLDSGWSMISIPEGASLNLDRIQRECTHLAGPWIWKETRGGYVGSESILSDKGYWVKVGSNCPISIDSEEGSSDQDVYFELEGEPNGTRYTIDPWLPSKSVYDLNNNEIENGDISLPYETGASKSFQLRVDGSFREFTVARPDFDVSVDRGTVSSGVTVITSFDFVSNPEDEYDTNSKSCETRYTNTDEFSVEDRCEFSTAGPGEIEVKGISRDNTPGTNLEASDTTSVSVEEPEEWEGSSYTLQEGDQKSFPSSVTCGETVVKYSSQGSLTIDDGDSSYSTGDPGNRESSGDFVLYNIDEDITNGEITFNARCGPESPADKCSLREQWDGNSCNCKDRYYEVNGECKTEQQLNP